MDDLSRFEAFWTDRLAQIAPPDLAPPKPRTSATDHGPSGAACLSQENVLDDVVAPDGVDPATDLLVTFAAFLTRITDTEAVTLGFSEPALRQALASIGDGVETHIPLCIILNGEQTAQSARETVLAEIDAARLHCTFRGERSWSALRSHNGRDASAFAGFRVSFELVEGNCTGSLPPRGELALVVAQDGAVCHWIYDPNLFTEDWVSALHGQFSAFRKAFAQDSGRTLRSLPLMSAEAQHQVLYDWNETERPYDASVCLATLFEAQVDRTPDAVALVGTDETLTYRELDDRSNQLAHHLRALGVHSEQLVGICLDRQPDLVVTLLATLKAGGAYVPLDPAFPEERLKIMIEDARPTVVVTRSAVAQRLPASDAVSLRLDDAAAQLARWPSERLPHAGTGDQLAYVLFTSGSTGRPKGVMVGQRNVVNFFEGMNSELTEEPPGTWLAVTSLSFDISVLELLWTLTRGFTVVLCADPLDSGGAQQRGRREAVTKPIDFSLFYFASEESDRTPAKYRLLLEGARFADRHGFAAVWTPERHFHAFGGLYPNPAVAGAAIAAVTERIQIRAGSCVLPLHNPIRVAEEWAEVDNLSNGRVGVSFAAGWQPDDFVLAPQNFAGRNAHLGDDIETVRKLWRGEPVSFLGPFGKEVSIRTLPRPIQPELPIWVTAAGNPDTFRRAGEIGANLLTHLLGQSLDELKPKLAAYRAARRARGDGSSGHVTLMLHTLVGDDIERVRALVREPIKQYLRSSVGLIEKAAWMFPTFAHPAEYAGKTPEELFENGSLSEEQMDALLEHSFERYFTTSGLFGTPESCMAMIDRLYDLGIDEVACLIDFGVEADSVLHHLEHLDALRRMSDASWQDSPGDATVGALIRRHGVTHLQCTPTLAGLLLQDTETRAALRGLHVLLVGGEALPPRLAQQLQEVVGGRVLNMYGPTETTVWSSCFQLDAASNTVPIGRPLANTRFFILDGHQQLVPAGTPGELYIGGDGVARGYLHRADLTAERFVELSIGGRPTECLYRTGDLVRWLANGTVEFLGRLDQQVKLRGYRIELGEIEALLSRHPQVRDAVVVVQDDRQGEKRLAAYVVPHAGEQVEVATLRSHLQEQLPAYMLPGPMTLLPALPLTPNGKLDRKALPAPDEMRQAEPRPSQPPDGEIQQTVARLWQELLAIKQLGVDDNLLNLGGHSLLALQFVARLRSAFSIELPLKLLFSDPTVRGIAREVERLRTENPERPAPATLPIQRLDRRVHKSTLPTLSLDSTARG